MRRNAKIASISGCSDIRMQRYAQNAARNILRLGTSLCGEMGCHLEEARSASVYSSGVECV